MKAGTGLALQLDAARPVQIRQNAEPLIGVAQAIAIDPRFSITALDIIARLRERND